MSEDRPEGAGEPKPLNVVVLGSTGSVGASTLSVIQESGGRLRAFGLAANANWEKLRDQARAFSPRYVAAFDPEAAARLKEELAGTKTEVLSGEEGLVRLVQGPEVDRVVSAIVGAAGLRATWAALEAGKSVALANKEALVVAGRLITELARERGAPLLPVDSEHSAIFQALQAGRRDEVVRLVLTSSGGPFRGKTREELKHVTVEQALRHPTWKMGPKITIDSATLMNKALEVIEARWLFDVPTERIEVVVHPESVVHSMVEFVDGSTIAQLSPPDMRLPVQYALSHPERWPGPCPRLDLTRSWQLRFEPPDHEAFPCLGLGYEASRRGGTAPAALNAANEVAVSRFLEGALEFLEVPRALARAMDRHPYDPSPTLAGLLAVDRWAREEAERWLP